MRPPWDLTNSWLETNMPPDPQQGAYTRPLSGASTAASSFTPGGRREEFAPLLALGQGELAEKVFVFYGIKKRADLFSLGARSWIDAIHHCAHHAYAPSIELIAAKQQFDDNGLANRPESLMALPSALEVLALSCGNNGYDAVTMPPLPLLASRLRHPASPGSEREGPWPEIIPV